MFRIGRVLAVVLLLVAVEGTLLSLANWQYHRYRQRLHERAAQAQAVGDTLTGTVLPGGAMLDNQPSPQDPDKIGWRLLQPLQTSTTVVVIDRGWLPLPADRLAAPDFAPYQLPATLIQVTGLWQPVAARKGWLQGPDTTTQPQILARLNPRLVHPQAASTHILQLTRPLSGQPPSLLTQPAPTANPATHLSYFIQWLSMAAIFPLLCLYAWRKRRRMGSLLGQAAAA